jgi:non-specific serine/threonine protein kinase/serine/threonine-protein kinase
MNEEESIFGTEPDRLMRLMRSGLEADEPELEDGAVETAPTGSLLEQPGKRIGRYKLLRMLGEGGMGIVYLAEQQGSIRRRVALKVIKPGMDSKRVLARFEAERQALALLDHPNIAHVYDSGTTEVGRPYFVMEHVKGLSITEHCDHYKLTIRDRLQLFQQVCNAVHHAHQKGIIHRDIKPSNILVSIYEDKAIPQIIDFGVAKAVLQPLTDRTLYTESGQLFGTPEYMSPEQADMANEDIDTRSDIYSLGVLLYELLTGVLPFDSETLHGGGIDQIRKVICETDPKTPSTRLTRLGEEAQKVAENRRTEIAALAKCLQKELEWIPLKAMRKDRAERYRSASEFVDDVENYLNGAPLIAGPPSTVYRLRKFVQRNRALATGVLAVTASLIVGLVVSTGLYFRAEGLRVEAEQARQDADRAAEVSKQSAEKERAARAEAERARDQAQTIREFLRSDVLGLAHMVKGREATVIDVLNAAAAKLDEGKLQDQLLIEASIRETLGSTYFGLGYYLASAQQRDRAYHIYLDQLDEGHWNTRNIMNMLAVSHTFAGNYREAVALYEKIQGDHIIHACCLAGPYARQGRYKEAERLLTKTLKTVWWDPNHPNHPWILTFSWDLAKVYREQGRYEDAEELFVKTLKAQREKYGPRGSNEALWPPIRCMNELARLYVIQKRYEEAEALFIEGIEMGDRKLPGNDHPFTIRHVNGLAVLRTKQQRYEEAETLFNRALEGRKLKLGQDHPYTLETKNDLATLYKEQGNYDKAEPLLLEALEGRRLKLGDTHPHTIESWNNLIDLYEAWNKPEEAEKWRAKLPQESHDQFGFGVCNPWPRSESQLRREIC